MVDRRITPFVAIAFLVACDGCQLIADDTVTIDFYLHAPELADDSEVYIAGSIPQLGRWNPGAVKMTAKGDHVWTHRVQAPADLPVEYKYTLGTWAREGADANGRPLQNLVVKADKDMVQKDQIRFWTNREPRKIQGQITGAVQYHRRLVSHGLRPRDVIVWLPPGYDDSNHRYPVLYMHDGQNIVDPRTSAFGIDWRIDETCTELINGNEIDPLIVVGIYNTPDRSKEYLPGEKGTAYRSFVVETVKPLIDRTYRTSPGREHSFVGGSSAGGVCAFMLVWEHARVFSAAICMSPAFQVRHEDEALTVDYVADIKDDERPMQRCRFYIDNGGVGLEEILQPGIDAMLAELDRKGLVRGEDYVWVHAPQARHNEAAWAMRFPGALKAILAKSPE